MGCTSCSPEGCGNKGHCGSGGCNKMNTYDWISTLELSDATEYNYMEVSFKNGARKEIFKNEQGPGHYNTGDHILVEAQTGYDVGRISLMGELVRLQMKKKAITEDRVLYKVIRRANERDLEKLNEARNMEKDSLVQARAIARTLGLEMKLGDVEYQGDLRKATFFYTANGRVDFRELVRVYAKEFRVKIEMRQIGSRQESARIGGLGSCGRELCCSTWLSDFRSVNTSAARYQNIAINQTKLSGQCGRLKCCLNYELDTYMDELQYFPTHADTINTKKGKAHLVKTDIFKGLMFYVYEDFNMKGVFHPLDKERVKEILALNAKGTLPEDLTAFSVPQIEKEQEIGYADVTGEIELPNIRKKKKNKDNRKREGDRNPNPRNQENRPPRDNNRGPERPPREQSNGERNPDQAIKSQDPARQNRPPKPRPERAADSNNVPGEVSPKPAGQPNNNQQQGPHKKKKNFNKFRGNKGGKPGGPAKDNPA